VYGGIGSQKRSNEDNEENEQKSVYSVVFVASFLRSDIFMSYPSWPAFVALTVFVRSIFEPAVRSDLERRVRGLCRGSARRWGRMSPHEAICHMSDAFRMALGEKAVSARPFGFAPVLRFVALSIPLKWPRGIKTLPEVEQGCGGTAPVDFERDRAELLALMHRFAASTPDQRASTHPIFGSMSTEEWGRWGYRHLDHHLRQFGL